VGCGVPSFDSEATQEGAEGSDGSIISYQSKAFTRGSVNSPVLGDKGVGNLSKDLSTIANRLNIS
jgi:hypothetical protein